MKRINSIIIALSLVMMLGALPAVASPIEAEPVAAVAPDGQDISVSVSGNTIRVVGAAKQTLVVYYVTGTKAASYSIDTDDQSFTTGLAKGVYLFKVGKFVRKVSIP